MDVWFEWNSLTHKSTDKKTIKPKRKLLSIQSSFGRIYPLRGGLSMSVMTLAKKTCIEWYAGGEIITTRERERTTPQLSLHTWGRRIGQWHWEDGRRAAVYTSYDKSWRHKRGAQRRVRAGSTTLPHSTEGESFFVSFGLVAAREQQRRLSSMTPPELHVYTKPTDASTWKSRGPPAAYSACFL